MECALPMYDIGPEPFKGKGIKRTSNSEINDNVSRKQRFGVIILGTCFLLNIFWHTTWLGLPMFRSPGFHLLLQAMFKYENSTIQAKSLESEVSWQSLKGGEHCLRYATREYTARLWAPGAAGDSMMRLCKDTPVDIHGKVLYTDFCQDLGFGRGVWGFWSVGFDEPDCETKWGEFVDLGCVLGLDSAHSLRVESRLENLQPGSNWQIMCATTPADIHGHHYGGPTECFNSPSSGTHGIWDLTDIPCEASH